MKAKEFVLEDETENRTFFIQMGKQIADLIVAKTLKTGEEMPREDEMVEKHGIKEEPVTMIFHSLHELKVLAFDPDKKCYVVTDMAKEKITLWEQLWWIPTTYFINEHQTPANLWREKLPKRGDFFEENIVLENETEEIQLSLIFRIYYPEIRKPDIQEALGVWTIRRLSEDVISKTHYQGNEETACYVYSHEQEFEEMKLALQNASKWK